LSGKVTSVHFAELNGAAGYAWGARVVAHSAISKNHADTSSAAAEISGYAAGTATMDLLGLSYVASDAGVPFPGVITLQVDSTACGAYMRIKLGTPAIPCCVTLMHGKSGCLRDSGPRPGRLVHTIHVSSAENLSDWLTRPLTLAVFLPVPMRARMMYFARVPVASPGREVPLTSR
jgi:hypothetical protein